ncbi:hypothetical protein BLNAU_5448 [Blattamonas nauphoetae]|uniref:Uncharacterized protein n=1 Tax=Blattamonas nauphoetae TaxID=2049346 RepID=A0ABQ9Y7E8_9EUKA|nr:hypothetical protein BLNAU_5448 [Blattamonas nauphoetae]
MFLKFTVDKSILDNQLKQERTARQKDLIALSKEMERNVELQFALMREQKARQTEREAADKERNELLRKLEEMKHQLQTAQAEASVEPVVERITRFGADVFDWFPHLGYTHSDSVITRTGGLRPTLLSFSFGKVVARFTFTFRRITDWNRIGIVTSSLTEKAKQRTNSFTNLFGGAGWDVFERNRCARQNNNKSSHGSVCVAGKDGQRVVLEADGRDGKRTLRLSQDGQTQPTFFSNIPVPFRFAILLTGNQDSVSIESVVEFTGPTLVGGTSEIRMDERRHEIQPT